MPDADAFRALARSSPWRWGTLRFTVRWTGERVQEPVRAVLRRPDRLRVETLDGMLVQVVREPGTQVLQFGPGGSRTVTYPWPADGPPPRLRPDGLVAARPPDLSYDAPMHQDYRWVAMLDPVELADGRDPDTGQPASPALEIGDVAVVDHGGRSAWEAVVRPTRAYDPRCGCCPLLDDRRVAEAEYADAWPLPREPAAYPRVFRVRLDAGTGVCVRTEELDGSRPGSGHDLRIEAVDQPVPDTPFTS